MTHIFLDTNIFLHFQDFLSIDWKDIVKDEYCLVICLPVVNELDKHKRNTKSKIAKRAKNALLKIRQLNTNESDPALILKRTHPSSIYSKYELDKAEVDQQIIAAILYYQELNSDLSIKLVSDDMGISLNAESYGIELVNLPEKYRLKEEEDPLQKENEILKAELASLKNRIPRLELLFASKEKKQNFKVNPFQLDVEEYINTEIDKIHRDVQKLDKKGSDEIKNPIGGLLSSFRMLSEEQIERYNKEVDQYYTEYRKYLEEKLRYKYFNSLSVKFQLLIVNKGKGPANNIDVKIHFPDGFLLYNQDEVPKKPKKPGVPYKPTSPLDTGISNILSRSSMLGNYGSVTLPDSDFFSNKPSIKKTNSYDVEYDTSYLKHNDEDLIDEMVIVFIKPEDIKSFKATYTITLEELPDPEEGSLNFIFD